MNQVFQYCFAMLSSFEHHTVNPILVKGKNSCCPPNTVTFGNRQNYASDSFSAVVGMHKNGITILRKPLITCLAPQQVGFILAIACASCDIPSTSDSMILATRIRAKIIIKVYHLNPPFDNIFDILSKRGPDSNIN